MIWKKVRDANNDWFMRFLVTCRRCGLKREFSDVLFGGKCFDDGEFFCGQCVRMDADAAKRGSRIGIVHPYGVYAGVGDWIPMTSGTWQGTKYDPAPGSKKEV